MCHAKFEYNKNRVWGKIMKTILYITGNEAKVQAAQSVLEDYHIFVEQKKLTIDEIQHADIIEVAIDKAKKAYEIIQKPLVVNDSGWKIPSLNGFPGAYMKDVNRWFGPEDWIRLMEGKNDKSIVLEDVTIYYDGIILKTFIEQRRGYFVNHWAGQSLTGLDKVISFVETGETIAERNDKNLPSAAEQTTVWDAFGTWYKDN